MMALGLVLVALGGLGLTQLWRSGGTGRPPLGPVEDVEADLTSGPRALAAGFFLGLITLGAMLVAFA